MGCVTGLFRGYHRRLGDGDGGEGGRGVLYCGVVCIPQDFINSNGDIYFMLKVLCLKRNYHQ